MDFDFIREEDGQIKKQEDDSKMRQFFIEFAKQNLNIELLNGSEKGIDLIYKHNPIAGAEGEDAGYLGDRWNGFQADLFGLGYNTLNVPHRKWFYWGYGHLSSKVKPYNLITHPGFEENMYFRVNKDYRQVCIVEASVLRDLNKIKFIYDRKVVNGKGKLEDWICIPQEYVKTYNKNLNGIWVLNGNYETLNPQERLRELAKNK